jgi:tetratricopeptide (TPR) repeat protein
LNDYSQETTEAMRTNLFFRATLAALVLVAASVAASAQVVTVTGKVTMKQADGTSAPVADAMVDFFRTDVAQKFQVKTNKKGEYVHAGIPLVGTFTIAVSAPGARPDFIPGVRPGAQPNNNFELQPGDGTRLTLEQIKGAVRPAAAAGGAESADAKKAREEYEKETARINEANAKIAERNTGIKASFEEGNKAFSEKRYDEAVAAYDRGIAIDAGEAVLHLNRSIALRTRAVDRYNAALKSKDQAARDAAKADFASAAESAEKAIKLYREKGAPAAGGAAAPAAQGVNDTLNYLAARYESYRIALMTNSGVTPDQAVKAIEEYLAAEPDSAKKSKAEGSLTHALFMSGRVDESIAASRKILASNPSNLDAMYWLGIALASDPEGKTAKEARDILKDFAAKAPATDTRKAEAEAAVAALEEAMAPKSQPKAGSTGRRRP